MSALFGRVDSVNAPPFTSTHGSVPMGDHIDEVLDKQARGSRHSSRARYSGMRPGAICSPPGTCAAARNACFGR